MPPTLLIVEDDAPPAQLMTVFLRQNGLDVCFAKHARVAGSSTRPFTSNAAFAGEPRIATVRGTGYLLRRS